MIPECYKNVQWYVCLYTACSSILKRATQLSSLAFSVASDSEFTEVQWIILSCIGSNNIMNVPSTAKLNSIVPNNL